MPKNEERKDSPEAFPRLLSRLRNRTVAMAHDLLMVAPAWLGAYWLRFNLGDIPPHFLRAALDWLPVVVVLQGGAFVFFGLYRGLWRFASLPDLLRILKAAASGTLAVFVTSFLVNRLAGIPRSVFLLYPVLLVALLGLPRFAYRWLKDRKLYLGGGRRTLIVGAGRAGEMLVRDILRDRERALDPIGFVDDDPRKQGLELHGVRVLGTTKQLPDLVARNAIDLVLIAIPSAASKQIRRVVERCEQAGVAFRMLPRMADLVAGRVSVQALRQVSIDDLLGRDPVHLDLEAVRAGLSGRCVLVTGGGGSIGSELCRQIARLGPARLVVFEASEFNLYRIERELRRDFPALVLECVLGDVTDAAAVERVFTRYAPQVVLHAAAYKHVPLLEYQLREAMRNNVLGTRRVAEAAARHGVHTFVLVSTDKAVNPGNVMGASKRVAELVCQAQALRAPTRFITVRFGNVLGSAGSVVPLFREQIEQGGPVTVTDPRMTRYFMTIPEACQLILQAGVMGAGGEIFVLDMGEPVRITWLA
ncbi:MAG: polysaccharide biosynthesis protein, partial [Gammaproteobacteria bacterium]